MKRRKNRGAFGGKKKKPTAITPTLNFDLRGEEFDPTAPAYAWPHTAPDFRQRLENLNWHKEWAQIWDGLLERYQKLPTYPHSVYEGFIRGNRGFVPMIVAATSPAGDARIRGLLYSCGINAEAPERDCIEALHRLGASACTQLLTQATGDPGYF